MKLSERISNYCKEQNLRCTARRLMLADFLQKTDGDADAEILYMSFRSSAIKISPASIYQMLNWMIDRGFVEKITGDNRRNIYRIRCTD